VSEAEVNGKLIEYNLLKVMKLFENVSPLAIHSIKISFAAKK